MDSGRIRARNPRKRRRLLELFYARSPWESLFDFRASRTCRGFRPSSSADAG